MTPAALTPIALAALAAALGFAVAWLLRASAISALRARLDAEREHGSHARSAELRIIAESLKNELARTSDELATRASGELLARADERLAVTVDPVAKKLAEMDALIGRIEASRAQAQGEVSGQLRVLGEHAQAWSRAATDLGAQTAALAGALRNPRMQGEWGELQLRRVIELAGMSAFADFAEQSSIAIDDARARPDVTVRLPGGHVVFVDAKAPIGGMIEIAAARDEAERSTRMLLHAQAIKTAVDGLARKKYHTARGSVDFVVMFVPGEGALAAACTAMPNLIEDAFAKGVCLASPLSLILLLQAFALGWQRVAQNDNAREIAKLGRELYESLAVFGEHFARLGKQLSQATASYNDAVGSYEKRLLVRGKRIKERAALTADDLPENTPIDLRVRPVPAFDDPQPSLLAPLDEREDA